MNDDTNPDPADSEHSDASSMATETWQKRWRIAGGFTVLVCAAMAVFGVDMQMLHDSTPLFLIYWGVFILLFFATLYFVALDLRYIRAEHAIAKRDLFQNTLGDQEFRETLEEAVRDASDADPNDRPGATH